MRVPSLALLLIPVPLQRSSQLKSSLFEAFMLLNQVLSLGGHKLSRLSKV